MRSRRFIWIVLCLLCVAGAWLFWHPGNLRVAQKKSARTVSSFVHSSSTAPNLLAGATAATKANQGGVVKTNRFAYRLANTTKSIGELVNDRKAILLENALIDTRRPLDLSIPKHLQAQGDPGAYIVQARGPINAAFRALLARAGAQIVSYIPNDAYLVRITAGGANLLAAQPPVQSVIPYEPYYKIQSSLLGLAVEQKLLPNAVLNLGLFANDAPQTIQEIEKLGGNILAQSGSPFGPVVRVQPPADWTALATLPGVQIVEAYHPRVHANDLSRATVGVAADTQVSSNYFGLTGKNVTVEVNDSGIDASHPDLMNRVFGAPLTDTDGHGTHVAGIIAGDGTKSMTVMNAQGSIMLAVTGQFRGMAPMATLLSMNFNDPDQQLQEAAAQTNALISNNSWNYDGDNAYDLAAASYDAATRDALPEVTGSQPVLFVFSAGNGGQLNKDNGPGGGGQNDGTGGNPDTIFSPATAKNVITVGAVEQLRNITNIVTDANSNKSAAWQPMTDSSSQVAGFSSRGNVGIGIEGQFGRYKPDVVAPGTFVISTRSTQWATNAYYNPTNDNVTTLSDSLMPHTQTDPPLQFFVFNQAVEVDINAALLSGAPIVPLPIYVWQGTPTPTIGPINNSITIPPAGTLAPLNTIWQCAVTNTTANTLSYTLTVDVKTTNNLGNYYPVLEGMNDSLGGYYRYETGTSMSAADVSGVLALMQQFYTTNFGVTPSPALMKAAIINGARVSNAQVYNLEVTNTINHEGWGLINLVNSLPGVIANQFNTLCDDFFVDQSPTDALATGDSHTYTVNLSNNSNAQNLPLRVTLAWTDPPGNPAAAIKLVNSLELVVTNSDNPINPIVYYGNDIGAGQNYNTPENSTNAVNVDAINNVQNVFIYPQPGTSYSITVIGRQVNVNAVTAQTNNVVQDYALVIACGEGEVTNAFAVTDNGIISNPTGDQDLTFVMTTNNQPLLNQLVGANTPLLGTNQIPIGTNTIWGTKGLITLGMTNQWHFYVVTNNAVDSSGNTSDVTNAAFITFDANTLSIPREGVFANSVINATRPQADIDLYVSTDPGLTNRDPVVISNCVNGTQVGKSVAGTFNGASLGRGGTEFVVDTNSIHNQVYYVGVKSEDQMASEYDFISIFTSIPLDQVNANGDQIVNGLNVPVAIPDGTPAHPGSKQVFGICIYPIQIERVVVTNQVWHQNFGDLIGTLTLNGDFPDVLNNHDSIGNTIGAAPLVYDDSGQGDIIGSQPSDGPGSLNGYVGQSGFGVWELTEVDDSFTQTGRIQNFSLLIQPHIPLTSGATNTVPPHSWFYDYIDVPPGYTNLTVFGTNLPPPSMPPLQMYLNVANPPTFSNYLFEADLTNGAPPGNSISYGPPLQPARYWVGVYNPDNFAHAVYLIATLGGSLTPVPASDFSTNGPPQLPDDAVTPSSIFISNTNLIESVNVGIVVAHPRISDLTFTLVSPTGQSILLMENRGGTTTNGAGSPYAYTNIINSTATGGAAANTNYLAVPNLPGGFTVPITYNFYTVPDEMTVYNGTDPATFYIGSPTFLYDTGFTNNPTGATTVTVNSKPGYTNIAIIMNQFGNPYATNGDAWIYTAGAAITNYEYLTFTEDTNLTTVPIKFAVPPYSFAVVASNYTLSDFEQATNGIYLAPTNIYDAFGGWTLNVYTNKVLVGTNLVTLSNEVSVVTDPADSLGDNAGTNFLALAKGTITRSIPTIPGRQYNVTFWYRGPGIAGWWRGEGNASDSSQPEGGNNGSLIGRFNFPAGEVGQAFEFADAGANFQFAGTNTYVQIPQSASLDVGTGGGLTVEGWINPTNVTFQQPLVEWLAKVPVFTNSPDTNFAIVAGPFFNRATDHYYYLLAATNWTTSEIWATNLGGHLATIDTANEQNWVYDTFANYGNTNRNLWIGLTNSAPGIFIWSSGLTNVVYTNWANGQPDNTCATANYTFMLGNTNTPGLWTLADNNGFTCANPAATNRVYGVVEVNNIQTNGVQFWISVTNTPGTTNAAFVNSNACLYANLVDISNLSHEIYSAPGLILSNIYQHVALTYDTNSGLAMLYYNGTNVATTNMGVFVPKTGGDVLLGRDMSRLTNNFYGGEMDEVSIYSRALSGAEIAAIYRVSAYATNGLTGKFDPSVTPAYGLAEAQVSFGTTTSVIYGVNNQWELNSFTFTATSNAMPLQISGLEPGILLDNFAVSETPLTDLYYLPEQSLDELAGDSAYGTWTLQVWDNRAGAYITNSTQLVNWQLQFVLQSNVLAAALPLAAQDPTSITVPPGQIVYLSVDAPAWARFATNILDSATGPVDLLFNPTNEPTGANPGDISLLTPTPSTGGIGSPVLAVNSPLPLTATNQTGTSYYLGVRNNGAHAVTAVVEVDFDITTLSNGIPVSDTLNTTNHAERYFAYNVSSNAFEATFQLLHLSGNADLVVSKGPPLPTLFSSDYGSFNVSNLDENIYVLTNSTPVPLSPGLWYLGVFNRDSGPVDYTVLAKELDATTPPTIINLTNRVPFNFTAGPGAALTNFFLFNVTNTFFVVTNAANGFGTNTVTTNYLSSIHFELYNLSGNGDLTVQTDAPPFAPPFFESSQQPGTAAELIYIRTNSVLTNLVAQWYLGVPNRETKLITYTIVAVLDTNLVFPAFPGAEGAGADAIGGRFGSVYHVTSLADSGSHTLRDAVSATNRTIVFDVSGTIQLLGPLVITNSFLTIAGQTAPGDGITVAGNVTTVQSAHDVIIRYVRFRSGYAAGAQVNGFEGAKAADYTNGQVVANSGWTVLTNQVSVVTDPINAYGGSNFLALANGTISNTLPTVAGQTYTLSFAYRGPGIAGWWRGENNVVDSISGSVGTLVNPTYAHYTNGIVGSAFANEPVPYGVYAGFDVPDSPAYALTNSLSIEGWIRPRGDGATVLWRGDNRTGYDPYYLATTYSPQLQFGVTDAGNNSARITYSPFPYGQWYHVAGTLDGNTGTMKLYVNGALGAQTNTTIRPFGQLIAADHPGVGIGNVNDGFNNFPFAGDMDEISLYSRALSASEIKAIYNTDSAGKFDPSVFTTSPASSLAEAQVSVKGQTPTIILGNNTSWQSETITFTATQNGTPVQISGIEPGVLLDASVVINADDSLRLTNVSDVVVDHVSTSWSTNNLVSVLDSTNVTVQWSMMADSIYDPNHPHGYGSRLRYGNGALTLHHNLYADNYTGNPRLGDNLTLDFVNNVIYNWGTNAGFSTNESIVDDPLGFTNQLNYVCNYLIAGSNSVMTNIAFWGGTSSTWIFQTNNFIDSNTNGILDGADTGWLMFTNQYTPFSVPFPPLAVTIDEAFLAYERVLDFAGAAMDKRDAADTNIVGKVRSQTGVIISTPGTLPSLNSTPAYLDTDQDGIPDFWEITLGENPTNSSANNDRNGDGYTDLEEYDNWLAGPHALTVTNTPVGVDLLKMFGKTGNLSFTVDNAVQGFVYLTNVLGSVTNTGPFSNSIAVFTPTNNLPFTTNYSGYAAFDVFVTNNNTIAYFGPVTVSVMVSAVPITYANVNTNTPPVFTNNLPNLTIDELTLMTVTNTATDTNAGVTLTYTVTMTIDTNAMIANGWPLTYATTTPPPVIDPNGIITWTPSEAQGPGVYIITTVVSDNGIPPATATNSFTVTVNEVNLAPFWPTNVPSQTNYTIPATTLLVVTNTATDSDIPPNPLTYQLFGPLGAVIDTNGIITWTPTVAQVGLYTFTTIVTDTNQFAVNSKSLSATNVFTVLVTPVAAPFAFTQPATSVTGSSAQLNGMATPNGLPTTAWFQWGTNTLYGNQTPHVGVGNGFNVVYMTNQISSLLTNVAYHFRLVASNALGVVYGFDQILDEANVVVWGANYVGQANVPSGLSNAVAIAGAYDHSLALKNNGAAVAWGDNTFGQANAPSNLSNLVAVAGGEYYSLALKNSGTVAAWGANILGQTNVPPGLNNVVMIAGGTLSSLALKNNGTVVAWGANFFGLTNVPPGVSNAVAVAGGGYHSLAIKNDGTVMVWGDNSANQLAVPAGLSNVVAIAGGNYHSLALKYDGTVVAWGDDSAGQSSVPSGLSNVVAIAAGGFHSLALKNDGTVVGWGDNSEGQTSVPSGLTNFVAIAAGYFQSLGLTPQSIASLTNIVLNLTNGVPQSNTISPGSIIYYQVNVPANADFATNTLIFADAPLNVWFSTNSPPTIGRTNDTLLFAGVTNRTSILSTNSAPAYIVPGATYYLGVQNTNTGSVFYGIEVDFHLVVAPPNVFTLPATNITATTATLEATVNPNGLPTTVYFEYGTTTNYGSFSATNVLTSNLVAPQLLGIDVTNLLPGTLYYFNVIAANSVGTNHDGQLSFTTLLTNPPLHISSIIYTNIGGKFGFLLTWFAPSNDLFQVQWNNNLASTNWSAFTNIVSYNTNAFTSPTHTQFNFFDDGSQTPPGLPPARFYRLILLQATNPPPQTNIISISSITHINNGITNGFLLKWFAPSNDLFRVQWTGSLPPTNWSTFTNIVSYNTNAFTSPTNTQFNFFDDGSQTGGTLGTMRFYRLILLQTANTLTLPAQSNLVVTASTPVTVTNTATDSNPSAVLTYSLVNAPTNAGISTNGIITWTNASPAGLAARFTTIVSDNGSPPLTATNTFTVFVAPFPAITNVMVTATNVVLKWTAPTNDQFQVQWATNLAPVINWFTFPAILTSANGTFAFTDTNAPLVMKFYRLWLLP